MVRAAIYVRVSDPKQEKGESLSTQLDACREYAAAHGYTVNEGWEFIESHTATELQRPQMDKLLDLAESGAIDKLILHCMDRLSRGGIGHQWVLENEFKRFGVKIEYVLERYEDTPEGELQKQLHASIAQYERAKLLERTGRGRRGRAKAGKFIPGGSIRYGYTYVRKLDATGEPGHVEINAEEADVVKLIFRLYTVDKLGTRGIARRLTEMGVPTRFDISPSRRKRTHVKGFWGWTSVLSILTYEGYTGVHYFNRATFYKDENGKQRRKARDRSEWIAMQIPAIIDQATWQAAQDRLAHNKKRERRPPKYPYLMRSRLMCANCGTTFLASTETRRKAPIQYYFCLGQKAYHSPDGKTVRCKHHLRADKWDAIIWDYVASILKEPETILKAYQDEQDMARAELKTLQRRLDDTERRIAEIEARHLELINNFFGKSNVSRSALETMAAQLNAERAELEAAANGWRAQLDRKVISDETIAAAMEWCKRAGAGLDHFTFEDKVGVINQLNVTGVVERGETPDKDTILVAGFLPAVRLDLNGELTNVLRNTGSQ